ncbi:hypothetical protein H6F44_09765 [Pseudanabaena sp. FACHB-1277]|jgi:hypothetical protein|uniref:Uncharacterized protein n=1 Tax=Pseudanabaena cinerea FACHB-1277 TaxID=2949581 RepID=A0A926UUW2_9CYAN|nr:hypothetical protein [Pseudanabaena cinerea]MBD2150402.1 hypothetical protein [Pseudanabaena cinerea FACHB-1277]
MTLAKSFVKKAFVGTRENLSESELNHLLQQYQGNHSYYFLRWADRVSGVIENLPDSLSPEGQMFNADLEIRWKRKGDKYNVLLLSEYDNDYPEFNGFDRFPQTWQAETRNAKFYTATETRFPKEFIYPEKLNFGQRYFKDQDTGIVHFVALTILDPKEA